jgi:protein-disulfide isomerase
MEKKSGENNVFIDKYLTPVALILAAIIIAGAFIFGHGAPAGVPTPTTGGATANPSAKAVDVKSISTEGVPYIGNANAPTSIAIYYDYQCPFCKQFEQNVTPQLIAKYVTTGKTKIYFKDFQFLGKDSNAAALFGRALWHTAPTAFYGWYVAMFNAQDEEGDKGFGNLVSIEKLSATIPGVDVVAVEKDMNANTAKYQAAIAADRAEGTAMGINGTPSIVVGTKIFTGLSPEQFNTSISQVLDSELPK